MDTYKNKNNRKNKKNRKYTEPNKFMLMLCELHYIKKYGKDEFSCPNIDGHYMVIDKCAPGSWSLMNETVNNPDLYYSDCEYDTDDSYEYFDNITSIESLKRFISTRYQKCAVHEHPIIRNYHYIVTRPDYIKCEIGEYILLPTQEAVAILKTIWLRIIQRTWKKVFKERQRLSRFNKNLPQPTLRGMLVKLKQLTK